MNKTININLGKVFFHIDEKAYEVLKKYLDAIKKQLKYQEGAEEVMRDIEVRIAELFLKDIKNQQQVVELDEVNKVIEILGQPKDFSLEDEEEASTTNESNWKDQSFIPSKKLYRETEDYYLAGVCGGLAHYLGTTPAIIRVLWIILSIISFGTFAVLYIALWIVVPPAITTSQKLEMKGESINLSNIEKKVKEDFEKVKEKLNEIDYEELKRKGKSGAHEIANGIEKSLQLILSILRKLIGGLIVFVAGVGLFTSFSALLGISIVDGFNLDAINSIDTSGFIFDIPIWAQSILFLLLSCIPLWLLLLLGLKLLNPKGFKISKANAISSLVIWGVAIIILIILGIASTGSSGISYEKTEVYSIPTKTDTLSVKMDFPIYYVESIAYTDALVLKENNQGENFILGRNIGIQFRNSKDSILKLRIRKKGFNNSWESAKSVVKDLDYQWKATENQLILNSHFENQPKFIDDQMKVNIDVYIPDHIVFKVDEDVLQFLSNSLSNSRLKHTRNNYFRIKGNTIKCLNCEE